MEVTKVSQEALQKAMESLGLSKPVEKIKTAEEIKKAEDDTAKQALQSQYDAKVKEAEELKAKLEGKTIEKAQEVEKIEIGKADAELIKGFEDKIGALATMVAFKNQENEEFKKSHDELKASVSQLVDFNKTLANKIGIIEKQPLDRKSVTPGVKTVERFEKGGDESQQGDYRVLKLSDKNDRAQLADIAFKAATKGGQGISDREFSKAVSCIELGSLGSTPTEAKRLSERFKAEHKVIVTR